MLNRVLYFVILTLLIVSCSQSATSASTDCNLTHKIKESTIQIICDENIVTTVPFESPNILIDTSMGELEFPIVLIREGWEDGFEYKLQSIDPPTVLVKFLSPYSSYALIDVDGDTNRDFIGFKNIIDAETEQNFSKWPEVFLFKNSSFEQKDSQSCSTIIEFYHAEILRNTNREFMTALQNDKFPFEFSGMTLSRDDTSVISNKLSVFLQSLVNCEVRTQ